MLRWFCAATVVISSLLLSMDRVFLGRQRIRSLRSLKEALRTMAFELETLRTPLPELLRGLAPRSAQPAASLLAGAAILLERRDLSFSGAWNRALEDTEPLCLLPEERQALENLGAVLGRGGAAEQGEALRRAEKQLELFLDLEEKERMKRNKVRAALGAGAGVMLAILLL